MIAPAIDQQHYGQTFLFHTGILLKWRKFEDCEKKMQNLQKLEPAKI